MPLQIYDLKINSRLLLGTALYPSFDSLSKAIRSSETEMVTTSLKRHVNGQEINPFWNTIKSSNCHILPNTAGCKTAQEAITIAHMAREIFHTNLIKLEVISDEYSLYPNGVELIKATEVLINDGFNVLPYCSDDISICQRLISIGCQVLMPIASPIGSGQGIINPYNLALIRNRLHSTTLIVDAGIGTPSDATIALEMGYDGVLLNSAIALAESPEIMAKSFALAIKSGHLAHQAKRMPKREFASNSTPLVDTPFWHQE
jgi:thiazole synthase